MGVYGGGPQAPDPVATAQAQNAVNKDALMTAAQLNQINQVGPTGSVSYSGDIGSPDRTQTTTLTPELQNILTGQTNVTQGLTDLANTRLAGAPTDDFSLEGQPGVRAAGGVPSYASSFDKGPALQTGYAAPTSVASAGNIQSGFDAGGNVQKSLDYSGAPTLNSDFAGLTQQAQDANYAKASQYLDPQFQQSDQELQSRLAAQGITQGSDAYNTAINNAALQKRGAYDDARNSAILSGNQLQQSLFGENLSARQQGVGEANTQGQFNNSAIAQQFGQNQAQAGFANTAQNQQYGQNLQSAQFTNDAARAQAQFSNDAANNQFDRNQASAQFSNDALANQFQNSLALQQSDQSLRSQGIQEDITGRNQNINEAMAYVNGAPISPQAPTFQPIAQSTAAQGAPDAVGLAASNYTAAQQAHSALLGSVFGAVGKIGGSAVASGCWVAREVYGQKNPEWLAFREWLFAHAPKWLKRLYLKHGEAVASWISDKPMLKNIIRSWMNARINACA